MVVCPLIHCKTTVNKTDKNALRALAVTQV
jgi:hypothetical protein